MRLMVVRFCCGFIPPQDEWDRLTGIVDRHLKSIQLERVGNALITWGNCPDCQSPVHIKVIDHSVQTSEATQELAVSQK